MAWFVFTPPGMGTPDPSDPNQYTLNGTGANPPSCPLNVKVCGLQAANNGSNHPIITQPLLQEIIVALQNGTESANVLLKGA